jgi:hypothetical protein
MNNMVLLEGYPKAIAAQVVLIGRNVPGIVGFDVTALRSTVKTSWSRRKSAYHHSK